ncbi:MAG: PTS sugar transporter subunit IIA [Clostridiales bacterium]|nr:PTS sugar transporter subunit IIA [Clostridiales bacterium]
MIKELLTENLVIGDLKATSKKEAILEMVERLDVNGKLVDKKMYLEAVLKREEEHTTGIGMGIAIPHGKTNAVKIPALVFARSEEGVEFDSMDGSPAHLLFMVAVPESANQEHLKILGLVSRKLMNKDIREKLMKSMTYEEVIAVLS